MKICVYGEKDNTPDSRQLHGAHECMELDSGSVSSSGQADHKFQLSLDESATFPQLLAY